jgi:hypothetical protein
LYIVIHLVSAADQQDISAVAAGHGTAKFVGALLVATAQGVLQQSITKRRYKNITTRRQCKKS